MKGYKYKPGRFIAEGGVGIVHEIEGSDGKLVMKRAKISSNRWIQHEFDIYAKLQHVVGIPKVKALAFHKSTECFVLIMENAGISLFEMFKRHTLLPRQTTKHLVAFFGHQMISILQAVHSADVIHGDVHPANFTYFPWRDREMSVRLIDFGAATYQGKQAPQRHGCSQINYTFASARRIASPLNEPSVVDDLVSLAYTLIYLIDAPLPWMEYVDRSGQANDIVSLMICKAVVRPEALCTGLPSVFFDFLSYVLNLRGDASYQDVDYAGYVQKFCEFSDLQFKGRK